jgi:hypothetical protein
MFAVTILPKGTNTFVKASSFLSRCVALDVGGLM